MNSFFLWVLRHRTLSSALIFLFFGGFVLLACFYFVPSWLTILLLLCCLFLAWTFPNVCYNLVSKKPAEAIDLHCDPVPLLELTKILLTYPLSADLRAISLFNHAAALQNLGHYPEAYHILSGLNMDKGMLALPMQKAVYYHNLASLCHELNDWAQADIWYQRETVIFRDLPKNKSTQSLYFFYLMSTAEFHYRRGEYQQVLSLLNSSKADSLSGAVSAAVLDAQTRMQLGQYDIATDRLRYVLANGNRSYNVVIAQKLLAQCTAAQSPATP